MGIYHLEPAGAIDVGIQVIELAKLDPATWDNRVLTSGDKPVPALDGFDPRKSDAIIININYPLGFAAYHLFSQIAMATDDLQGVYVLGKAATLNGRIGDVMLANVVYDEHSGNTFWFENCFSYDDIAPLLVFGAALDNQRAVTVKGTYLQNEGYLDFYYRENFTVVEMEAGPYLNAIHEETSLSRYPVRRGAQYAVRASRPSRSRNHPLCVGHAVHPGADAGGQGDVLLRDGFDLRLDDCDSAAGVRARVRADG